MRFPLAGQGFAKGDLIFGSCTKLANSIQGPASKGSLRMIRSELLVPTLKNFAIELFGLVKFMLVLKHIG